MAKSLLWFFVVVVASLSIANYAQALNKTLTPEVTQLQWDGWLVQIKSTSVAKAPSEDSLYVFLELTVKNVTNQGKSFIPQNRLKILVEGKEFDAADIDPGYVYLNNIEPTLTRNRACYFELPQTAFGNSFILRFKEDALFSEEKTVKIAIADAPPPTPTPTPETAEREQRRVESEANQKIVSTSTPAPFRLTIELADADLSNAWKSLTSEQRDRLGPEQRNWSRHRDSLPVEQRIKSTAERAAYIWLNLL